MSISTNKKIFHLSFVNQENNEIEIEKDKNVNYSKYNPFIFKKNWSNNKKFNNWYLFFKLFFVILIAIFGMLSLWYLAQWEKNTLINLGIDLNKYADIKNTIDTSNLNLLNSMKLTDFNSTTLINNGLMNVLLIFSLIGVIFIIPTLIFKNGTAWSIGSILFILICLIISMTILFMGIIDQQKFVSIYKSDLKQINPDDGLISASSSKIIETLQKNFLISTKPSLSMMNLMK